jgi:hypothetical protein
MNKYFYFILALTFLVGCTNKNLYEYGQGYQKGECKREAQTADEYNKCSNTERKSYEEYEKERKAVINN